MIATGTRSYQVEAGRRTNIASGTGYGGRSVESVGSVCRFGGWIASEKYQGRSYDSAIRLRMGERGVGRGSFVVF